MKIFNLAFSLILFTLTITQAQNVWPTGTQWTFEKKDVFCNPCNYGFTEMENVIDTVIEGKTCKKISNGSDSNLFFYVDSSAVFQYVQIADTSYFTLLYDFSFEVGDVYPIVYGKDADMAIWARVDSVGYQVFGTDTLKVQYLSDSANSAYSMFYQGSTVIEYVGPSGYFTPKNELADIYHLGNLRCFSDSTHSVKLVDYPCDSTWSVTGIKDQFSINEKLILSPNPVQMGQFYTLSLGKEFRNSKLRVYNILGNTLIQNNHFTGSEIDISNLNTGYYFVEIFNPGEGMYNGKFMVVQ